MFTTSSKTSITDKRSRSNIQSSREPSKFDERAAVDEQTQTVVNLGGKPKVQDDFRELLLEFVISTLLDQPGDVITYASEYFRSLEDHRKTMRVNDLIKEENVKTTEVADSVDGSVEEGPSIKASKVEYEKKKSSLQPARNTVGGASQQQYG